MVDNKNLLIEHMQFDAAHIQLLNEEDKDTKIKSMYMKGIFLQADVENHNKRVYPRAEIAKAVKTINEKITQLGPLPGECAHPEGLEINIDRVSHTITQMWMEGSDGMGKLKILPTHHGNIIKVLLENGVKLGVSSRGSGNVGADGKVYDFDIVTIDIVSQPSAPNAYPQTIYEQVLHAKNSNEIIKLAEAVNHDYKAQKFFKKEVLDWFNANLKK